MEKTINHSTGRENKLNIPKINAVMRLGNAEYKYNSWIFSSKSQHIKADDHNSYIVKFKNNPQGTRILANELVASSIAKLINVPCPEFSIINVNAGLVDYINKINSTNFAPGNQFASRYLPSKDMLSNEISNASNIYDWSKVIIFENLIQNQDFDKKHILLYIDKKDKKMKFCVIDHGCAFKNQNWTALKPKNIQNNIENLLYNNNLKYIRSIKSAKKNILNRIFNNITDTFKLKQNEIKKIINIPVLDEWGIDSNQKEAMALYMLSFSRNTTKLIEMLRRIVWANDRFKKQNQEQQI